MEHRHRLDTTSLKHNCPRCGKRTFVKYVDAESKDYAPAQYGRCDRADNCAYHAKPPKETKYYYMQFKLLVDYSDKAYKATDKIGITDFIPKSQVLEHKGSDCWVSLWCLKERKFTYLTNEYKYFDANNSPVPFTPSKQPKEPPVIKPVLYIPTKPFKASLQSYTENNFTKYLVGLFGAEITTQLITRYFIGTSKIRFINKEHPGYKSEPGANIFWQIDTTGKVRTGKIMLYNPDTGKRVKQPFNHVSWVHNWIKQPEYVMKQCLFGEHLLRDKTKPVAIVESEKTAIIASVYLPQFIWISAGMKGGLNIDKCNILKGRNVTLFPDIKAYADWNIKAKELSAIARVTVSELLESKATPAEREQGLDIADYLIRYDWRIFREKEPELAQPATIIVQHEPIPEPEYIKPTKSAKNEKQAELREPTHITIHHGRKPPTIQQGTWEQDINELERYFAKITLPSSPIELNQYTTITNVPLFIHSHMTVIKARIGNPTFQPYLNRLKQLKSLAI